MDERGMSAEERRRLAEAEADLEATSDRLEAELRQQHPELFDADGQLDPHALAQWIIARNGGKQTLSGRDLIELERRADASRSAHAP